MRRIGWRIIALIVCGSLTVPTLSWSDPPQTFRAAKRVAARIHDGRPTIYCGCRWTHKGRSGGGRIDARRCGLKPRKNVARSARLEWEHVMPAWEMGHNRPCWRAKKSGSARKNCRATDPVFRAMEADLYNLRPSVGELNADRSYYPYGVIPGEDRDYGACDFEVSRRFHLAEPPPSVRGNIARIYAYMVDRYRLKLSNAQRRQFSRWDKDDPVDADECAVNRRIAKIMGRRNRFVAAVCGDSPR